MLPRVAAGWRHRLEQTQHRPVTPLLMFLLTLLMLGTAFLSGVFGMAGGLVLIGVLFVLLPLPEAMALHAVTQMTSNGWRAVLWVRHVRFRVLAFYSIGAVLALGAWSIRAWVPTKAIAMLCLGISPHLLLLFPKRYKPNAERPVDAAAAGVVGVSLMLLTGASGPVLDAFFLGGTMDRKAIVATKAACQVLGHGLKLIYFASVIDQAAGLDAPMAALAVAASIAGTTAARAVLERMSDAVFRVWVGRLVLAVSAYYIVHGAVLLYFDLSAGG